MAYNRVSIWYRIPYTIVYRVNRLRIFCILFMLYFVCINCYVVGCFFTVALCLHHQFSGKWQSNGKKKENFNELNTWNGKKRCAKVRICLNFKNYTLFSINLCQQFSSISNKSKLFSVFLFLLYHSSISSVQNLISFVYIVHSAVLSVLLYFDLLTISLSHYARGWK